MYLFDKMVFMKLLVQVKVHESSPHLSQVMYTVVSLQVNN